MKAGGAMHAGGAMVPCELGPREPRGQGHARALLACRHPHPRGEEHAARHSIEDMDSTRRHLQGPLQMLRSVSSDVAGLQVVSERRPASDPVRFSQYTGPLPLK